MSQDSESAPAPARLPKRKRGPGKPWVKGGPSPNPGGCPKDLPRLVMEARRLALSHAPKAIERLAAMLDSEDERVVVAAAEGLLDRAGLKPFSTEPDRHEMVVATADVEALRTSLAARLATLIDSRPESPSLVLPPAAPEVQ